MQAQAQRNNQANPSQHSLFSQVSAQQMPSSGSAQLHDQKVRPPGPSNQGQKTQVSSSSQAFAPQSGTQAQTSAQYLSHDNLNQAEENVTLPTPAHTEASYRAYLSWYQPKTRCRLIYADMHPEPHVATPQDGYARHRDEALAGAVSQSYHRFSNTLD